MTDAVTPAAHSVNGECVPTFPRGVRLRHDDARQEWVLLAPERLIKADPIAAAILQLCDGKRTLNEIVSELAAQYKAEPALIRGDVETLLTGLRDKRMITL